MSGSSIVGALRVVLGLDSAAFDTGLKDTRSKLTAFSASMAKTGAAIGASFTAAAAGMAYAVNDSIKQASKLAGVAKTLGMPIEQLSALKYAAERSGASLEDLQHGFAKLSKGMAQANADSTGPLASSFKQLGINITDSTGRLRDTNDVFNQIVAKLATMKDGASKTALAMKFFGDSFATLLPLVNKGPAGIAALTEEARKMGLVIGEDTVAASKRYNDALGRMDRAQQSLTAQITAQVAPAMGRMADMFTDTALKGDGAKTIVERVADGFKVLEKAIILVMKYWEMADRYIAQPFEWGGLSEKSKAKLDADIKAISDKWALAKQEMEAGPRLAGFADSAAKMAKGLEEKVLAPIEGAMQRLKEQFQFDMGDPFAGLATKTDLVNAAMKAGILTSIEYQTALRDLQTQGIQQLHTEMKNTLDDIVNSPLETFAAKMAALQEAVQNGAIGFREFGQSVKSVNQQQQKAWSEMGSAAANALTSLFPKSKAAAIAAATINTSQSITKTLAEYGATPWGLSMAALAAAAGLGQIMQIRSASSSGGGSVSAPSVSMPSEPAAAPGLNRTLNVVGINPRDLFSGNQVRDLAEQLLQYQRDGGRVLIG